MSENTTIEVSETKREQSLWCGNALPAKNTQIPKYPNTQRNPKHEMGAFGSSTAENMNLQPGVSGLGFETSLGIWVFGYLGIYADFEFAPKKSLCLSEPSCPVPESLLEALPTAKMQRQKMFFSHQSVRASINFETTGSGTKCIVRRSSGLRRASFFRCQETADRPSIFALPRGFYEEKTTVRKHQQTTPSKERTLNSANN